MKVQGTSLLVFVGLAAVAISCSQSRVDEPDSAESADRGDIYLEPEPGAGSQALTSGATGMIYTEDLIRAVHWLQGESDLVIRTMEKPAGANEYGDEWGTEDFEYSASFAIQNVSTRDGQDFVVHGVAANGDDVVELWTFTPVVGSWQASRPSASAPVGTAVSSGGVTTTVVGGSFVAPSARQTVPRIKRQELYRGQGLGGIRGIAVDPDGRFVLAIADGDDGIYRIDIVDSGSNGPVLVMSSSTLPQLQTATSLYPLQHTTEGRIYVISSVGGAPYWVDEISHLYDVDNDGVIDGQGTLTHDQYDQLYGPEEVWADDFLNYD